MMTPCYSLEQLRDIERVADANGIDLMQRAARSAADWVEARFLCSHTIMIAVGTGNNGGDALWTGLNLQARGYDGVILFVPEPVKSPAAVKAFALCQTNGLAVINQVNQLPTSPHLVIDGLFGIGLNRVLSAHWQQIINSINHLSSETLALDTPSGFDAYQNIVYGASIQASTTLTFLSDKPALHSQQGAKLCGRLLVDLLDLPKSMRPVETV